MKKDQSVDANDYCDYCGRKNKIKVLRRYFCPKTGQKAVTYTKRCPNYTFWSLLCSTHDCGVSIY